MDLTEAQEAFDFMKETPLEEVKTSELQAMVKAMFELRAEAEELDRQASEKNRELDQLKDKIMKIFEALGRDSFDAPGYGKVYTTTRTNVKWPKDPELAAKAKEWLIKNNYENILTVNHQTLNAVYKEISEPYAESGAIPPDLIPGVGSPETTTIIAMRKGK